MIKNPIQIILLINLPFSGTLMISYDGPMTGVICEIDPAISSPIRESVTKDPHIMRYIPKRKEYICFDLIGKSQQKFILFHEYSKNLKIAGQLRDDYYFGKIIIQSPTFNYTIKADEEWKHIKVIDLKNDLFIEYVNSKQIAINIHRKYSNIFSIEKAKNANMINYLNFNILRSNIRKKSGGLFGKYLKTILKYTV